MCQPLENHRAHHRKEESESESAASNLLVYDDHAFVNELRGETLRILQMDDDRHGKQ
jgi:hypothetical protein